MKGKCQLMVHPKSKAKMKSKLKELTSRSNGWGYAKRKQKLKEYIRGWVGYYHLANMKRLLLVTDEWLRRRIRMCIWKAWKKTKTKVANLIRCGIDKYYCPLNFWLRYKFRADTSHEVSALFVIFAFVPKLR